MFIESMVCGECGASVVEGRSDCVKGCMGECRMPVQMFAKIVHQGKRCRLDLNPSWLARVAKR